VANSSETLSLYVTPNESRFLWDFDYLMVRWHFPDCPQFWPFPLPRCGSPSITILYLIFCRVGRLRNWPRSLFLLPVRWEIAKFSKCPYFPFLTTFLISRSPPPLTFYAYLLSPWSSSIVLGFTARSYRISVDSIFFLLHVRVHEKGFQFPVRPLRHSWTGVFF